MKKIIEKIIAITLVFVMIFNFSSVVLAEGVKIFKEKEPTIVTQNMKQEELEIIGEDISKRKLNEKHFILNDGTTLIAMYPENVHYEKNGKMEDIDNSLQETQVEKETVYKNRSNSYKAEFSKNSNENNKLVSLESDGHKISWLMEGAQKANKKIEEEKDTNKNRITQEKIGRAEAKIVNKEQNTLKANKRIEEQTNLENVTSTIKYESILNQIDLQYQIKAECIKESIIINDKSALQEEFIFRFTTGGLKAELLENKEIIIYKDNKEDYTFKIEAPYMFDSNNEYSSNIEVTLKQIEDTKEYILTIIPNIEWLEEKERVYPVTIDPTVSTSRYFQNIKDTYIFNGDESSSSRHRAHIIRVGSNNKVGPHKNPTRGLIKFTLPELNAGDQVIYAYLNICSYPDTSEWAPPGREIQIDVHKMTSDWSEESASWSNLNSAYDSKINDYQKYKFDSNNQCIFYDFNVTNIVKEWYTTGNNYGLMLKEHYETYNYPESDAYFISANTNQEAYYNGRPVVTIIYRNQTGIENYLSYHTQDVGRAGTVYTNDYNGNLVLTHYDVSTPGGRLPVSIKHVFNTNDKDKDIGYGKGYRLNLSQTIEFQTINSVEYAKYIDEDGTAHYFKIEGTIYKDEDGLGLKLYKDGTTCTIEDKSGNKSIFMQATNGRQIWYLTKVLDTEGNSINITIAYTSNGEGIITQVIDGASQSLTLEYNGDKLEKIIDLRGRVTKYLYTDSKLTQIQYSDNKFSQYTYDESNKLSSIKNIDGRKVGYEYYQERTSRVKKIQEYSSNNEPGNSLQISYGDNSSIFTDENGYSNTIIFNNQGNAKSIADFGKENNVNGAYGKTYSYGETGGSKNKLTLESKLMSIKEMPNNLVQNAYFDNGTNSWIKYNCQDYDNVQNIDNNNVFKFIGESDKRKSIKQEIYVSGQQGDIFNISSWIKTEAVPNEDGKSVRISLNIIGEGNSSQWIDIWVNTDSSSWQFASTQFITNYDYYKIDIHLICFYNANNTYFDNIGLFKEDFGESYTYDNNGNIVSTQNDAKQNSEFTYQGTSNLLTSINPKGGRYIYEYDFNNKNRLTKAINSTGMRYEFDHDSYGNTTSVKVNESRASDEPENNTKYYIKIASSNKYFDISGGSTENKALLNQWDHVGFENQKFILQDIGDGYYKIIASHTSKALDVGTTNGSIQQWDSYDTTYQAWKFVENSDGTYRVINKFKGEDYCLTLENDSKEDGALIKIEKWNGKQSQKVLIYKADTQNNPLDDDKLESNEIYHIKVKSSNLYLERETNETGSRVIQSMYKPNDKNQLWRIVRLENGRYKLINLGSLNGDVMSIFWCNNQNEQPVQMGGNVISNVEQEWIIRGEQTGTYEIGTAVEGGERRLTVYGDNNNIGTHMVIFDSYGGENQKFYFEKANLLDVESGAIYKIKGSQSGLFVGVDSNNILEIQNESERNQKWIIENLNDGYYKFKLKENENLIMNVSNTSTANGTCLQIHNDTGSDSQKFEIVPTTEGTYCIKPKITAGEKSLNVAGSVTTAGGKIEQWSSNEWPSQRFELIKVESISKEKYIETKAEYSADGRYQTKLIDTNGNETKYEYNINTGTVSKQTDAKGNTTTYEYDGLDRVTKVSKQTNGQTYQNEYTYANDRISSIIHNGTNYYFEYDSFGNTKQTKVGNQVLGTNNYASGNGLLNSFTYGNGQKISYNYDRFNRLIKKVGTNGSIEYTYNAKGKVRTVKDNINANTENYTYDLADRLAKSEDTNGFKKEYSYDKNSNVNKTKYTLGTDSKETKYNYDRDNRINSIVTENNMVVVNYDRLSRIANKEIKSNNNTYVTEYEYLNTNIENKTTEKVKSIKNGNNELISYTYDANGNIETIKEGNEQKQKYYYDGLNQLIREDNKALNKTIVYTYDVGGNIITKKEYLYTTGSISEETLTNTINYTYTNTNWNDQLTSFNGKAITYDEIGNPTSYDGATYTWQNGRELASISKNGTKIQYKYNDSGIRTSKIINGTETKYHLEGSKVIYETAGNTKIYYTYDESGDIIGLTYSGNKYHYVKNLQNDIIGILNSNLEQIVKYEYDSWGNIKSITDNNGNEITDTTNIGLINPYRYRSYRYDSEIQMYYLNSRYYNPEWGRFINADVTLNSGNDLLGHNLYTYCNNNAINFKDETGNWAIGIAISFAGSMLANILTAVMATVVTAGIVALTASIVKTEEKAKEVAKEKIEEEMTVRDTTVYKLIDEAKKVQYVGRTKDPEARSKAHRKNPARAHLEFKEVPGKYTKIEARGLEQLLIEKYSTLNRGNRMNNQINGIRWNNPKYEIYIWAAQLAFPESETFVGS